MKRISLFSGVAFMLFMQSCGGSESTPTKEKEQTEVVEEVKVTDCDCSEVSESDGKYMFKDELYSGSCSTKNSSDEVIEENEFKNGFITSKKIYTSVNGKLVLTTDMKYQDGKPFNGWITEVKENDYIVLSTKLEEYKNGKPTKEGWWLIDGGFSRHSTLTLDKETGWKCELNRSYMKPVTPENKELIEEFLICAEKWNIDHFFYHIK